MGGQAARGAAPHIVATSPPNGDQGRRSGRIHELRVTFDMPMGAGYSWCEAGSQYPRPLAAPIGAATARLARCRSNCSRPGLPSGSEQSFLPQLQERAGVPLEPVEYVFSTRGVAANEARAAISPRFKALDPSALDRLFPRDAKLTTCSAASATGARTPFQPWMRHGGKS